ncbi:hypothetical protein [uncultured Treponema sp.]|uniref:hypothetical protein n=1 Tax=uncultured Treponema sp. TaxID=162155 RepID=UPI0025DE5F0E|nr:hypothetical protein [uncultured Treponema sp.]
MKRAFVKKLEAVLLFASLSGFVFLGACSNHISDAKDAVDASKDADVDIEANIEVKFATMVLAYDEGVAKVTGLDSSATYAWYLDNESSNIIPNGAACTVHTAKLSPGIHTLLVVATLDGKNYTEKCTITIE